MPARCILGFLFEDDLTTATANLHRSGLHGDALAERISSVRTTEERWLVHQELCPYCSRRDTAVEAHTRRNYQSKRVAFHCALSIDVAGMPTSSLTHTAVRSNSVSSLPTRQLRRELDELRTRLLHR